MQETKNQTHAQPWFAGLLPVQRAEQSWFPARSDCVDGASILNRPSEIEDRVISGGIERKDVVASAMADGYEHVLSA